MAEEIVQVKGLKELQAFLNQLPAQVEANIIRGALRAGCNVLARIARKECPEGPEPSNPSQRKFGHRKGLLRDSIHVRVGLKLGGKVIGSVKAGGRVKKGGFGLAYYAHFVEKGTAPHEIHAGPGKRFPWGGTMVHHPGAKKHPFMRPALDTGSGAALEATRDYIAQRLKDKHGFDTSGIGR